ncbi:hypothetical protein [Streptomyces sp. NBC_00356]|uniref:hypothetical protein n=1 Tax=Streptomyces sp. NBC_00356 TaxID=2975724 RepID=UPI002E26EDA2
MIQPKSLAEIRKELAADAEGCEACAEYGECIDHDTGWLDEEAERIYREQWESLYVTRPTPGEEEPT